MTSPTQSAMEQQQREDLHARIMNLPCKFAEAWSKPEPSEWIQGYVNGHRDTRHAAAELAAEHASELRSLRDSLALARSHIGELREALDEILGVEICAPEGGHEEVREIHSIARAALNKEQP